MKNIKAEFTKVFDDMPKTVAIFRVTKLPKSYNEMRKPIPGLKRRVNPPLSVGSLIYWERMNHEYCRKLDTNETVWFFGRPAFHNEFNYPGTDIEFVEYKQIGPFPLAAKGADS